MYKILTKKEYQLLLFLEASASEKGGRVDEMQLNSWDFDTLKEWDKTGFIQYGLIKQAPFGNYEVRYYDSYVILSDEAFELAYAERKRRALAFAENRIWEKKTN